MAYREAKSLVKVCRMTESIKDFIHLGFFIASCFYAFNMTYFL